jgi:hypothetical protein
MKTLILFISLCFTSYSFAQSVELKYQSFLIKSRDIVNKGEFNTSASTAEIDLKLNVLQFSEPKQSVFLNASYFPLTVMNQKLDFTNIALGYKINFFPHILVEASAGTKDVLYFSTQNSNIEFQKKNNPYIKFHGHLALFKIFQSSIIGDGFILYGINTNNLKFNEVAVGISSGFKNNNLYNRIGYRLEYQSTYDSVESNLIFRHAVYYKINF